jgi:hypothetical protein
MAADPYLQLTFDAKRRIALAARSVDLPPGALAWGLWEVWEDVWRRKDAHVPTAVLAGCVGTDPRIPVALVAFGFLVEADGAHRLSPDDERRILLTHQQRVAAGKARAAGAERSAGGVLVGRSSDSPAGQPAADQRATSGQPAQDQRNAPPTANSQQPAVKKKKLAGPAPADPRQSVLVGPGTPAMREAAEGAEWNELVKSLFDAFAAWRGAKYEASGKDWTALKALAKAHAPAEILRRWTIGLQARYAARCSTFWDLRDRWNACAQPEAQGGAQGPQTRPDPNGGIVTGFGDEAEVWEAYRQNRKAEGLDP